VNKKYLKLARGKPCVRCGSLHGVVACHYSGQFSHQLGKGMGIKADDLFVAFLCHQCHQYFDNYEIRNNCERSQEFLILILKTIKLLLETGEITIELQDLPIQ